MRLSGSFKIQQKTNSRIRKLTRKHFRAHDRHNYDGAVKKHVTIMKFIVWCKIIVILNQPNTYLFFPCNDFNEQRISHKNITFSSINQSSVRILEPNSFFLLYKIWTVFRNTIYRKYIWKYQGNCRTLCITLKQRNSLRR